MTDKLPAEVLRHAGLCLALLAGHQLRRMSGRGAEQVYHDLHGRRIRLRTSNDRSLIVTASSADPLTARLDIEDCDVILLVMPTERRSTSSVEAYLLERPVAEAAVRQAHKTWLESNPATAGKNQTFAIWFDEAVAESGMFKDRWRQYRLPHTLQIERDF